MTTTTQTPDGVIPLPAGPHAWLWKLTEVRDWNRLFAAASAMGFTGLHAHSDAKTVAATLTRDLIARAKDSGIYLGASLAFDTGRSTYGTSTSGARMLTEFTPTAKEKLRDGVLRVADVIGPGNTICLNWEMRWETWKNAAGTVVHTHRKDVAAWLSEEFIRELPSRGVTLWDAPWWKPSVHGSAPTDEFGKSMTFRIPQDYAVYTSKGEAKLNPVSAAFIKATGKTSPAQYMPSITRAEYGRRAVQRPLAWGFQATAQAEWDRHIGLCLRDYPVTMFWHFLRLFEKGNEAARDVFRTVEYARDSYPYAANTGDAVKLLQQRLGLAADGHCGRGTVAAALPHLPPMPRL